jgi:hypothetical protein
MRLLFAGQPYFKHPAYFPSRLLWPEETLAFLHRPFKRYPNPSLSLHLTFEVILSANP